MAFGFVPADRATKVSSLNRVLSPEDWVDCAVPLLSNPREVVRDLHSRHLPSPGTVVVAVHNPEERPLASASFSPRASRSDGWEHRNAILDHLRRVFPHDLRRRVPVSPAVLMVCRDGASDWTPDDGAWMWALRDACTLHGLRCGAYITLTTAGWRVLGDGRSGRTPHSASWAGWAGADPSLAVRPGAPTGVRRQAAR